MGKRFVKRGDVTFEFDDADFNRIRKGSELTAAVRREAQAIASRARATAPVDSGEYRESIRVEVDATKSRARARVVAGAPHAALIESRTGNLRRAGG